MIALGETLAVVKKLYELAATHGVALDYSSSYGSLGQQQKFNWQTAYQGLWPHQILL